MVSIVVLPTPRWPKTPIRCGRQKRSANATTAGERAMMEFLVVGEQSGQFLFYCNSLGQLAYLFWEWWADEAM
jgi:hypothetical protein